MTFPFLSKTKSEGKKHSFALISYDALADWKKVVYVGAILFFGALVWSGYLLWSIQTANVVVSEEHFIPKNSLLDLKALQAVGDTYDKKAELLQILLTSAPSVVDPAK